MPEMTMRPNAPPLSAPPVSPERAHRHVRRLADIPEASPGPNAFAIEQARLERYRLNTNAFYQQAMARQTAPSPAADHHYNPDMSSSNLGAALRDSSVTTMSRFIDAGKPSPSEMSPGNTTTKAPDSPELRLLPDNAHLAVPTDRGYIEERRERMLHEESGSSEERIPVFISPMPEVTAHEDVKQSRISKWRSEKKKELADKNIDTSAHHLTGKTPRKGFLGRLKIPTGFRGNASPAPTEMESPVPVKASSVLGQPTSTKSKISAGPSPPKTNIVRSPSKRKGLFSRRNTATHEDIAANAPVTATTTDPEHPISATTVLVTPQTSLSDPAHNSYQRKPSVPPFNLNTMTNEEKAAVVLGIARSQSLKYFDHAIPPTPPLKNTPPDERAVRDMIEATKSARSPGHESQQTPSRMPIGVGVISTSGRVSPSKTGIYARCEEPRLITQPSSYSLHASVVPNLTDPASFEAAKASIDGLALEGFNMPAENNRSPEQWYSPSVYSRAWQSPPNPAFIGSTPHLPQLNTQVDDKSVHTKESSSSGRIIQICYPDLAKDPSINNLSPFTPTADASPLDTRQTRERSQPHMPVHGRTHSRDHSGTPRRANESHLFAHHVDDDLGGYNGCEFSPTFSHPSAAPSPLQTLPETVHTPPPPRKRKTSQINRKPLVKSEELDDESREGLIIIESPNTSLKPSSRRKKGVNKDVSSGLGIKDDLRSSTNCPVHTKSPARRNELFDNVPSLPAQSGGASRSPSSQLKLDGKGKPNDLATDIDVDPMKKLPANETPTKATLNLILETLNSRNNDISALRDEIRANKASADKKFAEVEEARRSTLKLSRHSNDVAVEGVFGSESGTGNKGSGSGTASGTASGYGSGEHSPIMSFGPGFDPSHIPADSAHRYYLDARVPELVERFENAEQHITTPERKEAIELAATPVLTSTGGEHNHEGTGGEVEHEKNVTEESKSEVPTAAIPTTAVATEENESNENGESDTLAELREMNVRLMEMASGLAEKIEGYARSARKKN